MLVILLVQHRMTKAALQTGV